MKALVLVLLAALLAGVTCVAAPDVNISGTWTGKAMVTPEGAEAVERSAIVVLKQEGSTVTGTAGPAEDTMLPISNGKLEGSKLTFAVVQEGEVNITFNMAFENGRLTGTAAGNQGGTPLKITIELTRAK
jgi:hypothetical protein